MTNRVKLDAYDWSQISQQAADRARTEKQNCSILKDSAKAYSESAKKDAGTVQSIAGNFDTNAAAKVTAYDSNAATKTVEYNNNHSTKVAELNTLKSSIEAMIPTVVTYD